MKKASAALLQKIFSQSSIPMCLLFNIKEEIKLTNQAFCKLSGHSSIEIQKIKLQDLIYKKDFVKITCRIDCLENDSYIFEELRILGKKKSCVDIAITITKIEHDKINYLLCTFYDIGCFKEINQCLHEKIDKEREKLTTTIKSIIRTQQLLEKLHVMPSFFKEIWKCKDSEFLSQKIVHLMCHETGLKYSAATILLIDDEFLEVKSSSQTQALQRFHLEKQHKLAQVFREGKKLFFPKTGELTVAINSPEGKEGVLQIFLNEKERVLLEENENLLQPHLDLLECFAEFFGMFLCHLRQSSEGIKFHRGVDILKEEMNKKEDFSLMHIRWSNFYECIIKYAKKTELLREEVAKNILSFKPTGSNLFYVGEQDFFLLVPSHLIRSEKVEAQKMHRKLLQKNYILDEKEIRIAISMGVIKKTEQKSNEDLLCLLLECVEESHKKNGETIYTWNDKIQPVRQRSNKKLE